MYKFILLGKNYFKKYKMINNILDKLIGKKITIALDGFLKLQYTINSLNYYIEYDILKITDNSSDNYLIINMTQIYDFNLTETSITIYLDNDTTISILS